MRIRTIVVAAAAAAAPLTAVGLGTTAAHAATTTATAVTKVTDRLDSGYAGNDWAVDRLTRTASVTLTGQDRDTSDCGESAVTCYTYTGTISDAGTAHATE